MKHILPAILFATLCLTGCEVLHRPGIVIKEKVTVATKHGPSEKMQDKVTLNADFPGLQVVEAAGVRIAINTSSARTVASVTDPKTGITTTTETQTPGGMYVSEHVRARGVADKSRIDATAAGATGVGLTFAAPAIANGLSGGATSLVKAINP